MAHSLVAKSVVLVIFVCVVTVVVVVIRIVMIHNGTIGTCTLGSQPRFHNEDSHRATSTVREQQALSQNFT
jgi:hypothetical protein